MRGLIVLAVLLALAGGLCLGLAAAAYFVYLVVRGWSARSARSPAPADDFFSRNRAAFDERMQAALAEIPDGDPWREWVARFGQVGKLSGDPHADLLYFNEGQATPPDLPFVVLRKEYGDPFRTPLPEVPYPFAVDLSEVEPTVRQLRALAEQPNLAALKLGYARLTEPMFRVVGGMTGLRALETSYRDDAVAGVRSLAGLTNLRTLVLNGADPAAVEHLRGLPWLTALRLGCDVPDAQAAALFPRLVALEALALSTSTLTPAGAAHLGALRQLVKLRYRVGNLAAGHLRALQPLASLRTLELGSGEGSAAAYLGGFGPMPGLEELELRHHDLSAGGLQYLAPLPSLRKLSLGWTQLTDAGLAALPPLPDLEELDLSNNKLTGRGLAALAGMPKLRRLHLNANPLEDDGLRHLVGRNELSYLDLGGTKVTRKCGEYFYQLPALTELLLVGVPITHTEAEALAAGWNSPGMFRHDYRPDWEDPYDSTRVVGG